MTSIRGMFADASRTPAPYQPDEDDEDGYGPKRPKSKVL